jgi:hypothetical protein
VIIIAESANALRILSELHPVAQVAAVVVLPLTFATIIWIACKYL